MRLQHCPPSPPSPLLTLTHPRRLPSLFSCSALNTPYTSAPPPHLLLGLQSLCSFSALKLCLQHLPHPPYASSHPPNPMCHLSSLCSWSALPTCL
ncbi:hypothetical protein O181_071497 [Austropuccinia psidii MF-1]|uniref:Uncharacterized protein n=1 Tax=Austropuccinia psidii MF-1 TaxID=1389203 RepID=A0A9Q3F7T9_9BASI|nr:hypothetical protein [Austropuccinia psidii MF-1]